MKISTISQYRDWHKKLKDKKFKVKIRERSKRIKQGNIGIKRSVGKGVSELIFDFGPGYRIYYATKGKWRNGEIILLLGSTKNGQEKAIKKAQDLWKQEKS